MKKFIILKVLFSIFVFAIIQMPIFAAKSDKKTYISLSPAVTEILFAINADKNLIGVSTSCNYPNEADLKEKVGNVYYLNEAKILKLNPNYIFTTKSVISANTVLEKTGIKIISFDNRTVDSVYNTIIQLGVITQKQTEAKREAEKLKQNIENITAKKHKRILYVVQETPIITVGKKSFINDLIQKSGQISVTSDLDADYTSVSYEYLLKANPEIIVVSFKGKETLLKTLFPNAKIIYLTPVQNDIINRPSTRIYKAVRFFSELE